MNLLFEDLHVIDIIFEITVTLHILLPALIPLYKAITLNLFHLTLVRLTKRFKPRALTLLFPNTPLFLPLIIPGTFFSRPTSQNPSVLSSDNHLLNIDLTTDQKSTPPTPNRDDCTLIVNDTL